MTLSTLISATPPGWRFPCFAARWMTGARAAIYDGRALWVSRAMHSLMKDAARSQDEAQRLALAIPVTILVPPAVAAMLPCCGEVG